MKMGVAAGGPPPRPPLFLFWATKKKKKQTPNDGRREAPPPPPLLPCPGGDAPPPPRFLSRAGAGRASFLGRGAKVLNFFVCDEPPAATPGLFRRFHFASW